MPSMKALFPGHYQSTPSELESLWSNALFVFDTNTIFDLYKFSEATRADWIKLLRALQPKLWMPYQVALEYQRGRLDTIRAAESRYDQVVGFLDEQRNKFVTSLDQTWRYAPDSVVEWKSQVSKLFDTIKEQTVEFRKKHPNLNSKDSIRDQLDSIYADRVGEKQSEQFLKRVRTEGKERYAKNQPPGFEDREKPEDLRYGDLAMWFEILEKAKADGKDIILITNDQKKDWWLRDKQKVVGPLPDLIAEFCEYTGKRFHAYSAQFFFETAKNQKIEALSETSAEETRAVSVRSHSQSIWDLVQSQNASSRLFDLVKNPVDSYRDALLRASNPLSFANHDIFNSPLPMADYESASQLYHSLDPLRSAIARIEDNDLSKKLQQLSAADLSKITRAFDDLSVFKESTKVPRAKADEDKSEGSK